MQHVSDTFQEYLMYLISAKKLTNAEVYKRAFVTKQLFSKIKLNPDYHPNKATLFFTTCDIVTSETNKNILEVKIMRKT